MLLKQSTDWHFVVVDFVRVLRLKTLAQFQQGGIQSGTTVAQRWSPNLVSTRHLILISLAEDSLERVWEKHMAQRMVELPASA